MITVHDIVARLTNDPGQDTACHYAILYSLARFLPARLALEIGVDDGSTTVPLLLGVAEHGGQLFSVDPAPCPTARAMVDQSGYADHWHFSQCRAADLVDEIADGALDLVFIDGDHSTAGVQRDWECYEPKVRPGGLILFHDTLNTQDFPGITALIDTAIRPHWDRWECVTLPFGWGLTIVRKRA